MNTPISLKIAKLLKEKGFRLLPDFKSSYPTIAEVVMWLYDKYGIWIGVQPTSIVEKFQFRTYWNNKGVMNQHWNNSMSKEFNSPIEAYEAAIEYTLNKLI